MKKTFLLFSLILLILTCSALTFADRRPTNESVVQLLDDSGNWFCTGFFVSKNVVVTAAHCVVDRNNWSISNPIDSINDWKKYSLKLPFENNWIEVPMFESDFLRPNVSVKSNNNEIFQIASLYIDGFYVIGENLRRARQTGVYNPLTPLSDLHDRAIIIINEKTQLRPLTLPSRWLFTYITDGPDKAKGASFETNSENGEIEYKEQNFYPMLTPTCTFFTSHTGIGYDSNSYLYWFYLNPPRIIKSGEDWSLLKPGASGGPTFYEYKNELYPIGIHNSISFDSSGQMEPINIDISTFGIKQFLDLLREENQTIDAAKEGPAIPAPTFKEAEPGIFATGTFKLDGHTYRFILGHNYEKEEDRGKEDYHYDSARSHEQIFIKSIKKIASKDKHHDRYLNIDEKEYTDSKIDSFSSVVDSLKNNYFNEPKDLWWRMQVSESVEAYSSEDNTKMENYAGDRGCTAEYVYFIINIDFRNPDFFMIEKIKIQSTSGSGDSIKMDDIVVESIERVQSSH